jgi:hypothetical protein
MSEGTDVNSDGLGENFRDRLVAIGKGAASFVPIAGGPLAEIVGAVIPGQRADRIVAYLRALSARFAALEADMQQAVAENATKIDLIEEGGFQAARATSTERIGQIVEAVARGLGENDTDVIRRKRLLVLFGELDDDEVALLNAYGRSYAGGDDDAFERINRPDPTHMQSTRTDMDRERLYEAGREHLLRLDLLKRNYGSVRKGQLPDFDANKGDFKHIVEVSYLGRMLLSEIGLKIPFDDESGEDSDSEAD